MSDHNKLSVVIPVLNERQYIMETIDVLLSNKSKTTMLEIIVVDAGSTDGTFDLAKAHPYVHSFQNTNFKGKKHLSLNFGGRQASHEIILFLDADSHVPMCFDQEIIKTINKGFVGGGFMLKHDKRNMLLIAIEWLNTLRYSVSKRFYGDQGVFCLASVFNKTNGYPERDIMESSFFCERMKKYGKIRLVPRYIISSSRRFYKYGIMSVFLFDVIIWSKCMIGFPTLKESNKYWHQ